MSSCDAYADCWPPFFKLLSEYWTPRPGPIYLNTETRDFAFPGLDIRCPRVGLGGARITGWGDRLRRCLAQVPTELILYMQEDYFITEPVDVAMIERLVKLMESHREISHISLARSDFLGPGEESPYEFLSFIGQRAEYRISAQAGLWRTSALESYLRRHETVWEFEWYGTRRAWRKPDTFLFVNKEYEAVHGRPVVPYQGTGVVHGRWAREVVEDLFADHGIAVDYATRGYFDPDDDWDRKPLLTRAIRRLRSTV